MKHLAALLLAVASLPACAAHNSHRVNGEPLEHWWPLVLVPFYRLFELIPSTRATALRLGLVRLEEMLNALVFAVEHPAAGTRVVEVPEMRSEVQLARSEVQGPRSEGFGMESQQLRP